MDTEFSDHLVAVWKSMAEHFLDTETRQDIPHTALLCLRAGLSIEEAYAVWLHDVSPVVALNLLAVAGEWAGWDEAWLVGSVRKRAQRRCSRHGWLWYALSFCKIDLNSGTWCSIERCMRVLTAAAPERRDVLAEDLCLLARHYIDFSLSPDKRLDRRRIERLSGLRDTLFAVLGPVTMSDEKAAAHARVAEALAGRGAEP